MFDIVSLEVQVKYLKAMVSTGEAFDLDSSEDIHIIKCL